MGESVLGFYSHTWGEEGVRDEWKNGSSGEREMKLKELGKYQIFIGHLFGTRKEACVLAFIRLDVTHLSEESEKQRIGSATRRRSM